MEAGNKVNDGSSLATMRTKELEVFYLESNKDDNQFSNIFWLMKM